ncbi:MAG: hypothetical protein IKX18_00860 [Muribaculaceae bacterium]|nr:hypothetical protein [Muribaculaceae bacterium]
MKRFYMILAAIAALAMTAQATVWETLEVGDWNNPTTYNGSYFDMAPTNFYVAHTGVQMLYTPDMLADMQGKQDVIINQLTFMFHCETFEELTREIVVFVQETDATEFAVNDQGIKQFFPIEGDPAIFEERTLDLSELYGEDVELSVRFNVPYTSGKGLLVTMAFDAQDDDNCTMGSDYAPFYTSGMGKAITYTNNWTGFYEFTQGNDFPNATASLGCGTNVELPLTKIGYRYEESSEPYQTPTPNVASELTDEAVVFTATGEGTVTLYIQCIDNETGVMTTETYVGQNSVSHAVPRQAVDTYVNVWAVAQATDDAIPGVSDVDYYVEIPALEDTPPTPPTPGIIPANPTADEWYDCGDESGFSKFYFTLPDTDVNGELLDPENLSYAVWINDGYGEVYQFTFPAEDYTFDLEEEDINEVPYYLYSNAVDFHDYYVYMYRTNEYNPLFVRDEDHDGNIGIQVFYYTNNKAKTQSEIAWLYEVTPEPPTPTEKTEAPSFGNGTYTKPDENAEFFELVAGEPSTIYYRIIIDDVVQNVSEDNPNGWIEYTGEVGCYGANGGGQDGHYVVEAYAVADGKLPSDVVDIEFNVGPSTGIVELVNGKTVAGVRYYNMAGQEMPQADGMTIVVTTYTDGTTSAVKVIK